MNSSTFIQSAKLALFGETSFSFCVLCGEPTEPGSAVCFVHAIQVLLPEYFLSPLVFTDQKIGPIHFSPNNYVADIYVCQISTTPVFTFRT
jgi:hypothetical protein